MISLEHFDKELGAMARDPQYADRTGAEILATYKARIDEKLNADEYRDLTDQIVATAVVLLAIAGGLVIWALL